MSLLSLKTVNSNSHAGDAHSNTQLEVLGIFAAIMVIFTVLFYLLCLTDPGYVPKQKNFLKLLERLVAENFHLDYVCVHCETLRPENADHCNFCNRCV